MAMKPQVWVTYGNNPNPEVLAQMKAAEYACKQASVSLPPEVEAFFREFPGLEKGHTGDCRYMPQVANSIEVTEGMLVVTIPRSAIEAIGDRPWNELTVVLPTDNK